MALRWDYEKDYIGRAINVDNGLFCNCYIGNSYLIIIYETENKAKLVWFALDDEHLNRMIADGGCGIERFKLVLNYSSRYSAHIMKLYRRLAGICEITIKPESDIVERYMYKEES